LIEVPRALARRFRAVLRQSHLVEGPRGPWPQLLARADREGLTLQARQGDQALRFSQPGGTGEGSIVFRSDLLAQFEGRNADPVVLEQVAFGKGRASWTQAGVSRTIEFETATPDSVPEFPALPTQFSPMPTNLLQTLAQAALTTARDSARYSLIRVQLRGKACQVVATDGKQLLVQGGFPFPWSEDVLVPRVPAFGLRELAGESPVEVGRTASHVAVRAGGWTFLLLIDTTSRYPDINQVIPRPGPQATCLRLHPDDVAFLLGSLPKLPGRDGEYSAVTLDLGQQACVRTRDDEGDRITEEVLARSAVSGPPVRLCMNRCFLGRALKLGFTEVIVPGPDKPLLCRDPSRTYVWMPLSGQAALAPARGMSRLVSADSTPPSATTPTPRRNAPMPAPQPNGRGPEHEHPTQPQADRDSGQELLAEAEALRGLLQDACVRAGRLVAALKQQRRQSRVVQQAMQSLRRLHHLGS